MNCSARRQLHFGLKYCLGSGATIALSPGATGLTILSISECKSRVCRQLQFGLKYFIGCSGAIVLILALQVALPVLRGWRLLFGYFTVAVVLCEKVRI